MAFEDYSFIPALNCVGIIKHISCNSLSSLSKEYFEEY